MKLKIVIRRRTDDFHASLESQPWVWGCGKSQDAAIGDMIRSHPEIFGVEIVAKN